MHKTDNVVVAKVVALAHLPRCFPLYSSTVSAGFPSPADDYIEHRLSLDELIIRNPSATFFVRVSGNSMTGAGIFDGDILVVDRSLQPKSGKIVVAVVDGECTVKRLVQNNGTYALHAENPQYAPIHLNSHTEFMVWGTVIKVIHDPDNQ